jgi:hypothetical protein
MSSEVRINTLIYTKYEILSMQYSCGYTDIRLVVTVAPQKDIYPNGIYIC